MGITIALRNEAGEDLELVPDNNNLLHRLLPEPHSDMDSMLGWIDWYGDAMFNHLQMRRFLEEWDGVAKRANSPEEKQLITSVRALAARCQTEQTLHLWFIGD